MATSHENTRRATKVLDSIACKRTEGTSKEENVREQWTKQRQHNCTSNNEVVRKAVIERADRKAKSKSSTTRWHAKDEYIRWWHSVSKCRIQSIQDLPHNGNKIQEESIPISTSTTSQQRSYRLMYLVQSSLPYPLPKECKELLKDNPEVHGWLGQPLRLNKLFYGDTAANPAWDQAQKEGLTSDEICVVAKTVVGTGLLYQCWRSRWTEIYFTARMLGSRAGTQLRWWWISSPLFNLGAIGPRRRLSSKGTWYGMVIFEKRRSKRKIMKVQDKFLSNINNCFWNCR